MDDLTKFLYYLFRFFANFLVALDIFEIFDFFPLNTKHLVYFIIFISYFCEQGAFTIVQEPAFNLGQTIFQRHFYKDGNLDSVKSVAKLIGSNLAFLSF